MNWLRPTLLTLELMSLCVILASALGLLLAWAATHVGRSPLGRAIGAYISVSAITCLATPMILHAAAWEATAGKFGWLTFSQTAARTYTGFAGQYGGLVACVWVHGMVGASMVALATWYGTSRVPTSIVEQARLEGHPFWNWWRIELPLALPWLIASMLGTALLAATEMTVVDLYGVRTLADEFYLFHAAQPSMLSILIVLVLPSILFLSIVILIPIWQSKAIATGAASKTVERDTGVLLKIAAAGLGIGIATVLSFFPFAGLIIKTGHQITVSQDSGESTIGWSFAQSKRILLGAPNEFAQEYLWTAVLAVCVALVCVPAAWILAARTREQARLRVFVDGVCVLLFLLPGPIVGIGVVHFFALPVPGFRTLYHGTLLPTVVSLSVRALPIAYWVLRSGYAGVNASVLDTARLEMSWAKRMWFVDRALLQRPLILSGCAAAIFASGDVPATLPVLPPGVVTVGTRLFALLHSGARYQEASLAFWYVLVVVIVAMVMTRGWKRRVA